MEFIPAKTLLSGYAANNSWFGSNYNMNIYKGCHHGCIYCDSRSECYRVENFDEVRAKRDALSIIERDLRSKRKTGVIGTGSMSDPYNGMEVEYRLTRGALELIHTYRFGVAIATKSALVTRDIDVLKRIQAHSPVLVKITITSFDDDLGGKIEPNVTLPSQRFEAIGKLAAEGIFAGILLMPVLPFLEDTDENIRAIVRRASESGAKFIYPGFGVTLRQNQREYFFQKLDELFPGVKQKYLRQYGNAYRCGSPRGEKLMELFRAECTGYGILYEMEDIIRGYRQGYGDGQLSLL